MFKKNSDACNEELDIDIEHNLGKELLPVLVSFVLLVVFFFLFESFLHGVVWLFKRYKIPAKFLSQVFKELVMLGLFSFVLFLSSSQIHATEKLHFEIIHYLLFMAAIVYIFLVGWMFVGSVGWARRFKHFEHSTKVKRRRAMRMRKLTLWTRVKAIWSHAYIFNQATFAAIRRNLIKQHGLPRTFNFHLYLRSSLHKTVTRTSELGFKVWLIILVLVAIAELIYVAKGSFDLIDGLLYVGYIQWMSLGLMISLFVKAKHILEALAEMEPIAVYPILDKSYDVPHKNFWERLRRTFFPCFDHYLPRAANHFWFRSKGLMRAMLQVMLLVQSLFYAGILVSAVENYWSIWRQPIGTPILLAALFPSIIIILVTPTLLAFYALATCSADYADREVIRHILLRQYQNELKAESLADDTKRADPENHPDKDTENENENETETETDNENDNENGKGHGKGNLNTSTNDIERNNNNNNEKGKEKKNQEEDDSDSHSIKSEDEEEMDSSERRKRTRENVVKKLQGAMQSKNAFRFTTVLFNASLEEPLLSQDHDS
jgi:hypothetical protein